MAGKGLTQRDREFIEEQRVAHLATADAAGNPHVVPICFSLADATLYFAIDQKPKRHDARSLKRLQNIAENPTVAVIIDHYDEDWERLGWVMLRGHAQIIESGGEHATAQASLKARYPQYRAMKLGNLPVVAIRIEKVARWGNLDAAT